MQRSLRNLKDKDTQLVLDFIFDNAFGNPIIFDSAPTLSQMKSNTWGKVVSVNTALYIKFADGGGMTITGTSLA